ncbi:hypothetical protein E2C01_002302 [Portunus trituberculatus]|uniref:Uncharacterized protein n=1 Tax=Portunus trituberculatus TaxID=210409 RepID=A0A5B7CK81_PORTR|nr:hypothetical protein [Portunus trituberculatus]
MISSLLKVLIKCEAPNTYSPNAEEPPNDNCYTQAKARQHCSTTHLTEANGDVVAADVWPNTDPEEVFPKSDCPAVDPPNILPGVEDAPNVPVPGVLCPNTVLAVLAAAVVAAGVREGAEETAGEVKAELEVDRLVKAEVEVVDEPLKTPPVEKREGVAEVAGLADPEPPPGVKARLKEVASPAGGEEKRPVVRAEAEEDAGMEVEAAVVVVEVELVEGDPEPSLPNRVLVFPVLLATAAAAAAPKMLGVAPLVWTGLPKMLPLVDADPKMLPELVLVDVVPNILPRILEAVTGALKTLPVAAVLVADAKKSPDVDVTNRAPDVGAAAAALGVVVVVVDAEDDPRRPDSTEVLFAKKPLLEEDTPLNMLLLPPPKKLPEFAENKLGWEVELMGGREASLLIAVSPILSASCSEPSGKLGVPEVLTLSPMTVAFEAVSESVEDEDDVDSVSATEAR